MEIQASAVAKRYGYQWIIKDFTHVFLTNTVYGIAGSNGSGKSTVMKLLTGHLTPTQGKIIFSQDGKVIPTQMIYQYLSLAAPYTDLINEYTLEEMFLFHRKFKVMVDGIDFNKFEALIQLSGQSQKTLQHFSSGMKQKIQLALAILSITPILLLDEPTSFLDQNAKAWFSNLLNTYAKGRIVIIASNDDYDLALCSQVISLQ